MAGAVNDHNNPQNVTAGKPTAACDAHVQNDAPADLRERVIRYADEDTFNRSLEKVFRVHDRLLAKLAE